MMKKIICFVIVLSLLLSSCAAAAPAGSQTAQELKVGSKTYSVDLLKALPATQASFKGVAYVGVKMTDLLVDAGFDPQAVQAVKAVAADGFTVNYEPALFQREDTIVAYQTADGALSAEDGSFRMVLPDQEGKLNPRMLVEIQVVE